MTVSGTPGTGTITLGSASSGYQSFASAYGGNATVDILITEGTAWEVARNCTYTHSGTTLTRGTLEASSTGSAISLTSSAVVSVILPAAKGNRLEALLQGVTPGGRLTLTSGTPVTTSDVTGATSIYYTPYLHNCILLWDGSDWVPTTFTETTLAVGTVTSGKNYDVFGYLSSGALALEGLAWTDDTTRATAVTLQDGRYCKSGDKTRLLLGTFRSTSTTATDDSSAKRYLSNAYNGVLRPMSVLDATDSWSYATNAWRAANASTANRVEVVVCLARLVRASAYSLGSVVTGGSEIASGIGIDSTTTNSAQAYGALAVLWGSAPAFYSGNLAAGYHYLQWLENVDGGTTVTFYGDRGGTRVQAGLNAEVIA